MNNQKKCFIWGTPVLSITEDCTSSDIRWEYNSPRAGGKYTVSYQWILASKTIDKFNFDINQDESLTPEEKTRLSGYIAKENLKGNINIPDLNKITKDGLNKLPPIPNLDERAGLLLEGLTTLYPNTGETISLNMNEISNQTNNPAPFLYALSYSENEKNFKFLLFDTLIKDLKYIEIESDFTGGALDIKITPKGWNRIKEFKNKTLNKKSTTAFIAMWFDPSMDRPKKSIKKAVVNAGYQEPLRIDEKIHNNKIDDEILAEIDQSFFVVCDLTSEKQKPRGSVYFEAGYATGKNIPVIYTCSKELKEKIPFDVRQHKILFWDKDNMKNFISELQEHIEKNEKIGPGPLKEKG